MRYHAFISYSHRDKAWGDWAHKAIETFRVPKDLIGRDTSRGEPVPARLFPVFRDREELPTSADLGSVIRSALEQSRYLIVICSRASARSRWVNEEILIYKRLGRENRILALIVDGEPNAADAGNADDECFPDALKHPLRADGTLDRSVINEPIAADARPRGDGKINALLKLAAGLLAVSFDDLKRRDERRRRRRMQIAFVSVSALVLVFAALAITATLQWRAARIAEAETQVQRDNARRDASDADFRLAVQTWQRGATIEALPYLARSIRNNPSNSGAVSLACSLLAEVALPVTAFPRTQSGASAVCRLSPNGRFVATQVSRGHVQVCATESGRALASDLEHASDVRALIFGPGESVLVGLCEDGSAQLWDTSTWAHRGALRRTGDAIKSAAFSPDGRTVVTGGTSGEICLWDVDTQAMLGEPLTHTGDVECVSMDSSGKLMVSQSRSEVRVWDMETRALRCGPFPRDNPFASDPVLSPLSSDGRRVLIIHRGVVEIRDTASGTIGARLDHGDRFVTNAAFSPDGTIVVTTCGTQSTKDSLAVSWNTDSGEVIAQFRGHVWPPTYITFSPDGRAVATTEINELIHLWDPRSGNKVATPIAPGGVLSSPVFTPQGDGLLVSGGSVKGPVLWHLNRGGLQGPGIRHQGELVSAALGPGGRSVMSLSKDGTARLWDGRTGAPRTNALACGAALVKAEFSPDGSRVATLTERNELAMWDVGSGKQLFGPLAVDTRAHASWLRPCFSPDGSLLAINEQSRVRVLDTTTGQTVSTHALHCSDAKFSIDGARVVATGENAVHLIDARTGQAAARPIPVGNLNVLQPLLASPDRSHFLICTDLASLKCQLRVLDLAQWKIVTEPIAASWRGNLFSPRGDRFSAIHGNQLELWETSTGRMLWRFEAPPGLGDSVAFSADGTRLLYLASKQAYILDGDRGVPLAEPIAHDFDVRQAVFSPDGLQVATWAIDHRVRLWDARSGQPIGRPLPAAAALPLAFSPDGRRLLASYDEKTATLWGVPPASGAPESSAMLAELLEAAAGKRVTSEGISTPLTFESRAEIAFRLIGSTSDDPLIRWQQWILRPVDGRPPSPFLEKRVDIAESP